VALFSKGNMRGSCSGIHTGGKGIAGDQKAVASKIVAPFGQRISGPGKGGDFESGAGTFLYRFIRFRKSPAFLHKPTHTGNGHRGLKTTELFSAVTGGRVR